MAKSISRRWHRGSGLALLALTSLLLALSPISAAALNSQMGRAIYVPTGIYGSWGTIGTTAPYVPSGATFEFIMTYNWDSSGHQHFVQSGWTRQTPCGSSVSVFVEYFNGTNYTNRCRVYFPWGDNDYATQYNPTNGWWCHDYNGNCILSEPSSGSGGPGLTTAYYVSAYGETNDPSAQMGGNGQANAIYLSNLRYFDTSNNVVYIHTAGSSYGNGCQPPPSSLCPYGTSQGFAGTVLWTDNWTN
jgi:hypothetical protein